MKQGDRRSHSVCFRRMPQMTFSPVPHPSQRLAPSGARPTFDAFFSYGFRPFFLGAGIFSALAMGIWTIWIALAAGGGAQDWLPVAGSPFAWHAHEMVFGFAGAALAGFLLTAVPNWTGGLPLSGLPLVVSFAAWLAGRLAMGLSGTIPYALAATIDVLFLPLIGAFAARQLLVKPMPRNLVFLAIIAALTLGNVSFHLANAGYIDASPLSAVRFSMLLVITMTAIIAGRIVPAFTHNWVHIHSPASRLPSRIVWLDATSILSIVAFLLIDASGISTILAGLAALIAAGFNGARLALWRGVEARKEPIVWILHLGYAWIVIGLVLSAMANWTGLVTSAMASHAFGTGAIGTMILAVMSRASLGHTGRRLIAPPLVVWSYGLVTLAALLRVMAPMVPPELTNVFLGAAAMAWIAAFALFTFVYAPILTTPRVHTKVMRARP